MAAVRGGSDDNRDRAAVFAQLRQITAAVDVPVTADLEGGYDLAPGDLVDALIDAGAVGCNIEDTDYATADRLLDAEAHAAYLAGIRAAAHQRGVGIVLNARIDAIIRHPQRDPSAAMDEVLRRARPYLDAGADCVYPISLREPALVAHVVTELDRPVNVNPSEPLAALAEAGAARISLGGGVHNWMVRELERRTKRLLVPATPPRSPNGGAGGRPLPITAARRGRASAACTSAGVGERLRVVAEMLAGRGINLLGVQTERRREPHERVEAFAASSTRPDAASACTSQNAHGRNAPSPPGRPSRSGRVAVQQRAAGVEACSMAPIVPRTRGAVRRLDAEERQDQTRGVEIVRAVAADVVSRRVVIAARVNVLGDRVAFGAPVS